MSDDVSVYRHGSTIVAHGATWAWNPRVTKQTYADKYAKDPVRADRDYGANPPKSVQAALSDVTIAARNANKTRPSPMDVDGSFHEWFKGLPGVEYYLHIDMSKANDPTGIGMCHYDNETGKVIVDLIHNVDPTDTWELSFGRVEQFILTLVNLDFTLTSVSFDSWQSYQMLERLTNKGLPAHLYSVDRGTEAYDTLIETILTKKLDYYPQARFLEEMEKLKLYKGKKYDHPPGGSKDTADGVAGAVSQCVKARVGLSVMGAEVDKAIHDEHVLVLERQSLLDDNYDESAVYWKLGQNETFNATERNRVRIARVDVWNDTLLFVLGWNDSDHGRLYIDEFLEWEHFTNSDSLLYLQQFIIELMGIMRISAFSLNELIPLELVTFLGTTGTRVSSPLSSRVQGGKANTVARTIQVTPTAVRMAIQQLKKGNLSIPRVVNLVKDLKYTTEDNQMQRPYLKALAGWTDFASREMSFGRSGNTMPRPITGVSAPVNPLNTSRAQPAAATGRTGTGDIDRIRAQYSQTLRDSQPTPRKPQNSVRSLPRPIRGR
jgi:hypothetical protein